MGVFRVILCLTLILTVQCVKKNTKKIKELSNIIRQFTGDTATRYLYLYKYRGPYNFVFSGLRIVGNLITMYNLGSKQVKAEIKKVLGLTRYLEINICETMNFITTYDAIRKRKSNVVFNSKIFYRSGMNIKKEAKKSSCVGGSVQVLNFTDQQAAMDTINDFYPNWDETEYGQYLSKPLGANTNEVVLNRLMMSTVLKRPFYYNPWHSEFTDIQGDVVYNSYFIEKVDDFLFEFYEKHNVYLFRENFVGERLSYVIIFPKYKTKNVARELYLILKGEMMSDILLKAASLTNKTRMGMRMPLLEFRFRVDLKDVLPSGALVSLEKKRALSGLTDDMSNMTQFPHSEFTHFSFWDDDPRRYNVTYLNIDKPFVFLIMDNKFDVPLKLTTFTGMENYFEQYDRW